MKLSLNVEISHQDGALVITDKNGRAVTFSKDQVVQKKISMITLGELSAYPKLQVAKAFGYSTRKSYYDIRHAVLNGVPADLFPQTTGPKSAPKRTREVEALVIKMRFETEKNMYEIADALQKLGFDISARLVGQILSDYGLTKKKTGLKAVSPRLLEKEEIEVLDGAFKPVKTQITRHSIEHDSLPCLSGD